MSPKGKKTIFGNLDVFFNQLASTLFVSTVFNDRSVEIESMWINPLTRAPSLIKSPSWVHMSGTLSLIRVVPWQRYKTPWPQSFNPWPQLLVANTPQSRGFKFKGVENVDRGRVSNVCSILFNVWAIDWIQFNSFNCLLSVEQSGTPVFTSFETNMHPVE